MPTYYHKGCRACQVGLTDSSLNSSFDEDLKSHLAYELTCNGCKPIYVGHTCRPITTRVAEHAKSDSPILALILALMKISSPN